MPDNPIPPEPACKDVQVMITRLVYCDVDKETPHEWHHAYGSGPPEWHLTWREAK